ncbi:MAG: divergent polysaccharide deacetylase family protein [Gammaproteobacteria bacterium]|nr:divergent polysaccharide deacetylase family protein [Gammaproteobacteria bacterium]
MRANIQKYIRQFLFLYLLAIFSSATEAAKLASIIIDDIGNSYEYGQAVINLPAPITLSILPKTEFAAQLATQAYNASKEVMLHLPLQSIEHHKPTPGTLKLHMTRQQFSQQVKDNIASVPYIRGINNHMGSLLSQHPGHMDWLMAEVAKHNNMFFVDSLTSSKSVITEMATAHQVPNLVRDVFLDPDFEPDTIHKQFDQFIDLVNKNGHAIAIAHPHPSTLSFLKDNLSRLAENGIELVPVSKLLELRGDENHVTCTGPTCSGL